MNLIERTSAQGTVTAFPIYDAHGNDVASLTRTPTGFRMDDRRSYDAWGQVRAQQSGGDPKLRYCASLGHKADDESGLVYMRARYYEPASGRFLSEDPGLSGRDWFVYCGNDPINKQDRTGQNAESITVCMDNVMKEFEAVMEAGGKTSAKVGELSYLLDVMIAFTGDATEEGEMARTEFERVERTPTGNEMTAEVKQKNMDYWAGESVACGVAELKGQIYQWEMNVAISYLGTG